MHNASITLSRSGVTVENGYRKAGVDVVVLRDEPCFFSPERGAFSRNADGIREYVKYSPKVMVCSPGMLNVGMKALVTYLGAQAEFTVSDAQPVEGFLSSDWQLSLERIQT